MTRVRLVFTHQDSGAVAEYQCELPVTIGRGDDCTILVDDPAVSREHARLEQVDRHMVVTDLGSANGTSVAGQTVQRMALSTADRIRVGPYDIAWSYVRAGAVNSTRALSGQDVQALLAALGPRATPAQRVIQEAEARNQAAGHELDGFLSTAHGFLPVEPPLLSLPPSHAAWDDVVDRLPELFRTLRLRRALDALPVLEATPEALPDRYLLRASTLLGTLAHAYWYVTTDPPPALPPGLLLPWQTVSTRLGKPVPAVSYIDLFLYNWRLRDPAGPRQLDNMDLLVPAWDNATERVFYLVTAEFAMALTPVLGGMIEAQAAVLADDRDRLGEALVAVHDGLRRATDRIYRQLDPNPLGRSHLDQVLWAKTVGTSGVPILDGAPSPSGTAQPVVHALDAFLERQSYATLVGRQSTYLAGHFPRHWKELVAALREVSVRQFVERSGDPALRGLYNAVLTAYAGDRGWMGLHRIKAYGFLEVAFTVGRQVTTGARFTGLFRDRTWDAVDDELAEVRAERRPPVASAFTVARPLRGAVVTDPTSGRWTCVVELDVAGQGLRYQPGDRLGVLAENAEDLVRRTLRALQATGDEVITLDAAWQDAVRHRAGYPGDTEALPLRVLLAFGRIRPVSREVAKRLLNASASGALKRIVDARMEDQWELWDLLGLLQTGGFDVTRLWTAPPSDPDSICRIVLPEEPRLYSLASAMPEDAGAAGAPSVRLVVGGLTYTTQRTSWSYAAERHGTASHFLRRIATGSRHRTSRLSVSVVPTPSFRLPADPDHPVVMIAGGSGVAPFCGFAEARARAGQGDNWLFLGARTPEEIAAREPFELLAARGRLHLHTAFSRADARLTPDPGTGRFVQEPGTRQRIDRLLAAPEHAAVLWTLLRPVTEGGRGAHVYVCGQTSFAQAVLRAVTAIAAHELGTEAAATLFVRRMFAEGRLSLDVFTSYAGHAQEGRPVDVSELVAHCTPDAGLWMTVGGRVHDVSEFVHLHAGGPQIIRNHVGVDATGPYRKVLHHRASEVDALLGLYEIGTMRRLRFGGRVGRGAHPRRSAHDVPGGAVHRLGAVCVPRGRDGQRPPQRGRLPQRVDDARRGPRPPDTVQGPVRRRGPSPVPRQLSRRRPRCGPGGALGGDRGLHRAEHRRPSAAARRCRTGRAGRPPVGPRQRRSREASRDGRRPAVGGAADPGAAGPPPGGLRPGGSSRAARPPRHARRRATGVRGARGRRRRPRGGTAGRRPARRPARGP